VREIGTGGSAFIVGRNGPVVRIPVGTGTTNPPSDPPLGGRGGVPGDDYPWKNLPQDSQLDPWREYVRECTSFAAWALHSRNGFEMPFYANAIDWGTKAAALGYPVNGTPALGAIAWSQKLPWGHVAWVSDVSGGTVTIQEYNEYGNGTFDTRSVAASTFQYIHFKDLSAPTQTPPPVQPPSSSPGTHPETTGGLTHTWTNYTNAGGTQGSSIGSNQTVQISCKLQGFVVADGNPWWYQVASSPWNNGYYASADAFYNNGATSGSLAGTPFVDPSVPDCTAGSPPPPPPSTYSETTGGVTHTWTNYSNAGGTQGSSINAYQTVQIACKVTGFQVADGNTWWYRIASSPWNGAYYASADAFYNNGQTSGSLVGTPFVDNNVPNC
jgi:surface antigen